jgi:hypothetical protein
LRAAFTVLAAYRKTPEISGGAASMWLLFRSLNRSQSRISAGYEISLADNLLRNSKNSQP